MNEFNKLKKKIQDNLKAQEKMKSVPCTSASTPVTNTVYPTDWFANYSLGTLKAATHNHMCVKQEGNNPMNYATATVQAGTTETQDQRKYLTRRLEDTFFEKERPLYAQFGLTDDDAPVSPKELKKRLEDGKFIVKGIPDDEDDEDEDQYFYGGWVQMIRWRDPAKKADQDGYDAARKDLKAKYQEALDIIKIDEPKAGLDAIKALEAWTPTGAAN